VTGMFQASSIRPNKNQRIIKAVFKTHMEVFHIKKAEAHRVARERLAGPEEFFHEYIFFWVFLLTIGNTTRSFMAPASLMFTRCLTHVTLYMRVSTNLQRHRTFIKFSSVLLVFIFQYF
jgi:hypothetical protein